MLGIISGAVAGLVAVTPASGFVNPTGALVIGIVAGVVCYFGAAQLKHMLGYDDSLDAFGVHGVGGIVGALLTGVFAVDGDRRRRPEGPDRRQCRPGADPARRAACVTSSGARVVTFIILKVVDVVDRPARHPRKTSEGLDISQHGETVH